jgi:hypothetical protein
MAPPLSLEEDLACRERLLVRFAEDLEGQIAALLKAKVDAEDRMHRAVEQAQRASQDADKRHAEVASREEGVGEREQRVAALEAELSAKRDELQGMLREMERAEGEARRRDEAAVEREAAVARALRLLDDKEKALQVRESVLAGSAGGMTMGQSRRWSIGHVPTFSAPARLAVSYKSHYNPPMNPIRVFCLNNRECFPTDALDLCVAG